MKGFETGATAFGFETGATAFFGATLRETGVARFAEVGMVLAIV
jgi:hypothetical protein